MGIAYSLGSGVLGDGVIKSITVGCAELHVRLRGAGQEPTPTTLAPPAWTDQCGTDNDDASLPEGFGQRALHVAVG